MSNMKTTRIIEAGSTEGFKAAQQEPARKHPLEMIWHRKWIVLITTALCVSGAYGVYSYMTPLYTSTSEMEVRQPAQQRPLTGGGGDAAPVTSNIYTQPKILTSTVVLADAVALMDRKWTKLQDDSQNRIQAAQDAVDTLAPRAGDAEVDEQLKKANADLAAAKRDAAAVDLGFKHYTRDTSKINVLKDTVRASVGEKDGMLAVSFDSPYPVEAQLVVDAVVESYIKFNSTEKHNTAADSIEKIDADHRKWEAEIDTRSKRVKQLREEIDQLHVPTNTAANEQKQKSLSQAADTAVIESINAQAAYEDFARAAVKDVNKLNTLLSAGKFEGMPIVPGSDAGTIQQDIHVAQQNLGELQQRFLPNHPAVQNAKTRLDELNAQYVLFLHQKWTSAKNKEATLCDVYTKAKQATEKENDELQAQLRGKMLELDQIDSSVKQTKALMDSLVTRSKEISFADDLSQVQVKIIEPASLPTTPTRPVKKLMLFEGLLVGLILGISMTFLDTRLRSVEEMTTASGLPVLGVIPHMPRNASAASRGRKVHLDPMSDVSEAYRAIRTAVYFGPRGAKTILVTSPARGEGKSTLASNLAITMAEAGQKVLLIDGDLRDPVQHRIFATSNEVGVSTVVSGRTSADRSVQSSQIKGLEILPCGPVPFNPAETINNQTFADLLQDMANKYDYVVVDSAPVMAVTDARILGAMCDLTLLVLRAEKSTRKSASDARDGLMGFGANLLGVVVNDGRRDKNRYGYYGGYGQNRGTQPEPSKSAGALNGSSRSPINGDLIISSSTSERH